MAWEYFLYHTGFSNTLVARSNTSFAPSPPYGEIYINYFIPQTQSLYLFRESGGTIVYNDPEIIEEYQEAIAPPPTPDDYITYSQFSEFSGATTAINTDMSDPTGFVDGSNINISYNWSARQITLTGELSYYWKGVKRTLTSPWTSAAHAATVGMWFLYTTDGVNFTWSQSVWTFEYVMVSAVYYQTTESATFAIRETHELLDWHAHETLHSTIGTYLKSGGQATAGSYTENTATDTAVSPSFNTATVQDEDLQSTILALNKASGYTLMYVSGSTSVYTLNSTRPFLAAGTNQYIYYYPPTTGVATLSANNRYLNVYQILVPTTSDSPSQKYRMLFLLPQTDFTSLNAAFAEDTRGLRLGSLTSASAEFVLYSRITYFTGTANTNYGKVTIPTGGITYIVGSKFSSLSVANVSATNHANLSNLTWANSGHLGNSNTFAGFDASGNACNVTLWSGSTINGVGTYVNSQCICSNPNLIFDGTKLNVTGNVYATTNISSPIISGSTCMISPIVLGSTCVCSPVILGSTSISSPIISASTCLCSIGTTRLVGATTAASILNVSGITKFQSDVCLINPPPYTGTSNYSVFWNCNTKRLAVYRVSGGSTNYYYRENLTTSTTTSTTPIKYLGYTGTTMPVGIYQVDFTEQVGQSNANSTVYGRFQINGVTQGSDFLLKMNQANFTFANTLSRDLYLSGGTTAGQNCFDVYYWAAGGTACATFSSIRIRKI